MSSCLDHSIDYDCKKCGHYMFSLYGDDPYWYGKRRIEHTCSNCGTKLVKEIKNGEV